MPEDQEKEEPKKPVADEPSEDVAEAEEPAHEPAEIEKPVEKIVTGGSGKEKFKAFLRSTKGKVLLAVLGVLLVLGILFAVPATRYGILGMFIKKSITITVLDMSTDTPVSEVDLQLGTANGVTDADGKVSLTVPVGIYEAVVSKKYYKSTNQKVEVGLFGNAAATLELEATGRPVPVTVLNKVSGKPLAKATITAEESVTTTNDEGEATLVVPADKQTIAATIKTEGFNDLAIEITVTSQKDTKNTFSVVPAGTVYFLSKRTGKIDVMKSDLDGGNVKTVLAGTGKESESETSLLTSRDWKYLALHARRDGDKAKVYLIDSTKGDELSVIDEGDATFQLLGWYDSRLAYVVERNAVKEWEPKKTAVKSFDAPARKITVLQENSAEGGSSFDYAREWFSGYYLVKEGLVFTKQWTASNSSRLAGKKIAIFQTGLNGENKKTLKEFDETDQNGLDAALYEPQEIYYKYRPNYTDKSQFFEFENGAVKSASNATDATFEKEYPTFLLSPSGDQSLWSESRDGKRRIYVGDANAGNPTEVFSGEDYLQYGWFGDYVLISKNRSELFIMPKTGVGTGAPIKVTDYHRPDYIYSGYGYGYGGF